MLRSHFKCVVAPKLGLGDSQEEVLEKRERAAQVNLGLGNAR